MDQEISGTLLLDSEVLEDPYPFFEQLRGAAPVWEASGTGVYAVSTFQLLVEASARVEDFSSHMKCLLYRDDAGLPGRFTFGDAGGQALATADPPLHEIHRRAVFPELVTKRMEALDPEIRELADGLVTRSFPAGTIEFMGAVGNVVPITMISRLIGFRDSNLDELWRSAVHMTRLVGSTLTLDELVNYAAGGDQVQAWIADQVSVAVEDPSEERVATSTRSAKNRSGRISAQPRHSWRRRSGIDGGVCGHCHIQSSSPTQPWAARARVPLLRVDDDRRLSRSSPSPPLMG